MLYRFFALLLKLLSVCRPSHMPPFRFRLKFYVLSVLATNLEIEPLTYTDIYSGINVLGSTGVGVSSQVLTITFGPLLDLSDSARQPIVVSIKPIYAFSCFMLRSMKECENILSICLSLAR